MLVYFATHDALPMYNVHPHCSAGSMYNAHPYFPLKSLGKKCTLCMAKYGILLMLLYSGAET